MKNIVSFVEEKLAAFRKEEHKEKIASIRKLEEIRLSLQKELDNYINALYRKRDYIREAIAKKTQFKKFKISVFRQLFIPFRLRLLLSAPFIYSMIFPAIFLHIFVEIYHQIGFRLYGIPRVHAREHFIFDRQHLSYLNWFEKLNCGYCSYFNCLISYTREIAGRTERFWCPIKHAQRRKDPHDEYDTFFDYLDAEGFRKNHFELRRFEGLEEKKCFNPSKP